MSDSRIFVRVKRKTQTYCLLCDASTDTVETIKTRVLQIMQQHADDPNHRTALQNHAAGSDASSSSQLTVSQMRLVLANGKDTILSNNDAKLSTIPEISKASDCSALLYLVLQLPKTNDKNSNNKRRPNRDYGEDGIGDPDDDDEEEDDDEEDNGPEYEAVDVTSTDIQE